MFLNLQYSKVSRDAMILKLPLAATAQRWSTTPTSLVGGPSHVSKFILDVRWSWIMGPLHLVARLESTYHIIMVDCRVTFIDDPQIVHELCAVHIRICNVRAHWNMYSSSGMTSGNVLFLRWFGSTQVWKIQSLENYNFNNNRV